MCEMCLPATDYGILNWALYIFFSAFTRKVYRRDLLILEPDDGV